MSNNSAPGLRAGGTIYPSRFLKMSTTQDNYCLQAGADDQIIGISQVGTREAPGVTANTYAATTDDEVQLFALGDIASLEAGTGGWTAGDYLESDANGKGVSSGAGSVRNIGAIALETVLVGEIGKVQVLIFQKDPNSAASTSSQTLTNNLTFGGSSSGDNNIVLTDNYASALAIKEGSNAYLTFVTTNGGEKIVLGKTLSLGGTTGNNIFSLTDNLADALNVKEGSNSYLKFVTTDSSEAVVLGKAATGVSLAVTAGLTSSGPTGAGIGYATGAGGTVSQGTDRTTGVTLSKLTGQITTQATSLAAGASVQFTVTNTTVAIGDTVVCSIQSGPTTTSTSAQVVTVAAGSFKIMLVNSHASTADTGAAIINFAVIKGVAA